VLDAVSDDSGGVPKEAALVPPGLVSEPVATGAWLPEPVPHAVSVRAMAPAADHAVPRAYLGFISGLSGFGQAWAWREAMWWWALMIRSPLSMIGSNWPTAADTLVFGSAAIATWAGLARPRLRDGL